MHRLGLIARYRLLLTGTVITNKAIDVFSQYKFVDPRIFGNSFYAFRNRYFNMVGYGNHTPVLKKSMEQDLMRRLHSIAFRATKAECLDLPEITDIVRPIELEPLTLKKYKELVRQSYTELSSGEVTATNILTRLLRLSQLTGGFIGSDEGRTIEQVSDAKLKALEDILDSTQQEGQKLVIIARFIPEIHAICRMLEKKNIGYACIYGAIKDRQEQITMFQNDPDCMVFVGQIATAGLGITLTAASTMVFYSLDYSMSNFEQTKARIHRVGQKNGCTYIYLIAKGTVDSKILTALRNKAVEERLASCLDEIDVLKERYRRALEYMEWFQPAWDALSEEEQLVLTEFFVNDVSKTEAIANIGDKLFLERAQVYRRKDKALNHLALLLYGK